MRESFRVMLPTDESFATVADENLLAAAQRAHWLVRYGCRNGNCEVCAATLIAGAVDQGGQRIDADTAAQTILLCRASARSDLRIELPGYSSGGSPVHGSLEHARRDYAALLSCERRPDGAYAWVFNLGAGRRPPLYTGQQVLIEAPFPLRADIGIDAVQGRELTVVSDVAPTLAIGERIHLRYPLGYTYRLSASLQPWYVLHEASLQARASRLHAWLDTAGCVGIADAARMLPRSERTVSIFALATSADTVCQWYADLLARGVRCAEMRSDFGILRPWRVCRQDDNGNRFVVATWLDETAARVQAQAFSERGHKQLYWAEPDRLD